METATSRQSGIPLVPRVYDLDSAIAQRFGSKDIRSTAELALP